MSDDSDWFGWYFDDWFPWEPTPGLPAIDITSAARATFPANTSVTSVSPEKRPTGQFEQVQVIADGVLYEGWESVIITCSMEDIFSWCQLTTTEVGGLKDPINPVFDKWNFPPGTPITILATGTPVFAGVVDLYAPVLDANQHSITVTARTYSKDFAESSVKHTTGNFEDMTDVQIVQQFAAAAGVPLTSYVSRQDLIPYWQIRQGATNYEEAMRILQQRGKMLWAPLPDGTLVITDGLSFGTVTDSALVQGVNCIRLSARLTDQGWSLVDVIGQGRSAKDLQPFGVALNPFSHQPGGGLSAPFIGRSRYLRIIDQAATTGELAMRRAAWEMRRSIAGNLQATFTVPGWRTQGTAGDIWRTNHDVYCFAPALKIDCILRTLKVVLTQDAQTGTTTTITCVDGSTVRIDPAISTCWPRAIYPGL